MRNSVNIRTLSLLIGRQPEPPCPKITCNLTFFVRTIETETASSEPPKSKGKGRKPSFLPWKEPSETLVADRTRDSGSCRDVVAAWVNDADRSAAINNKLNDARLVGAERTHTTGLVRYWRGVHLKAVVNTGVQERPTCPERIATLGAAVASAAVAQQ